MRKSNVKGQFYYDRYVKPMEQKCDVCGKIFHYEIGISIVTCPYCGRMWL